MTYEDDICHSKEQISRITMQSKFEDMFKMLTTPAPEPADSEAAIARQNAITRLIAEDKHLNVNIGQKAIGYIKSCLSSSLKLVDMDILKFKLAKSWKHYNDFWINCTRVKLYVMKANFGDHQLIAAEISRVTGKQIEESLKMIESLHNGMYGVAFSLDDESFAMIMNTNYRISSTAMQHEFTHFVQYVTGELILDGKVKDTVKDFFGVSDESIEYMMKPPEFWVNIFNDLFDGMQKIYWKHFKDAFSWNEYVDAMMNGVKQNLASYTDAVIYKMWKTDIGINIFYLDILTGISYLNPAFFDEIVEKLKNKESLNESQRQSRL